MYEEQINELRNAWFTDSMTHLVTIENRFYIQDTKDDLYLVNSEYAIQIHLNYENTKYVSIFKVSDELGWGSPISHFSLDKFFSPEMVVKVLHQTILKLNDLKVSA
jgi:hypothetical protein